MSLDTASWGHLRSPRYIMGATIGRHSRRLKTALLRCHGEGWALRCVRVDALSAPSGDSESLVFDLIKSIRQLVARSDVPFRAISVIGVDGFDHGQGASELAALIAEKTGVTVVSDFGKRDRASGGRGGPLGPTTDWLLHRSAKHSRLVVHLGPTLRVSLLKASEPLSATVSFDVGPCCAFLDELVCELSRDAYPFDPGGRFAVQGHCQSALLSKWNSHPYLLIAPPKFLTGDEFSAGVCQDGISLAGQLKLSARDVLCTANHFIAMTLKDARRRYLADVEPDEVIVTGGGARNGLLWKLMQEQFGGQPVLRTDDLGIPAEVYRAAHFALLAYCTMENLAANLPSLSGAAGPRLLGQITPGDPENWDRWVVNVVDRFDENLNDAA